MAFVAASCGMCLLASPIDGIKSTFGPLVQTFSDASSFGGAIASSRAQDIGTAQGRAELVRDLLARQSFLDRARIIVDVARNLPRLKSLFG
jgi:hypothetical protein